MGKKGRPTLYKEEYCTDIVDYFQRCQAEILVDVSFFQPNKNSIIKDIVSPLTHKPDDEGELAKMSAGQVKSIKQKLVMMRFPTFIRYAIKIGVNQDTLYEWAKNNNDFSESMARCKQIQEAILVESGLQGLYNPAFAQFILKNNHGYRDKQEVENTNVEIKLTDDEQIKIKQRLSQIE